MRYDHLLEGVPLRVVYAVCSLCLATSETAAWSASSVDQLRDLSIEDLANVEVTSVTKSPVALSEAPSAVYVITHDAIVRSGFQTVPEILRLAPNLFVAQVSPSRYIVTARGLSGSDAAQNFTNKLLVLIDGRSVYTPIFSGVYWDQQDVSITDIDRIEVISGTGSTLWGANAVNGVINIITRNSADTQGLSAQVSAGTQERSAAARYGGKIGEALSYRAYVQAYDATELRTLANRRGSDGLTRVQGGFRLDWDRGGADRLTFQGDAYDGNTDQVAAPSEDLSGRNVLARWTHDASNGNRLELQAYYDHAHRGATPTGLASTIDTYDLALQQNFDVGRFQAISAGGGARVIGYAIQSKPNFYFDPAHRTQLIGNAFVQDSITLADPLKLIVGLKLEHNYFSGLDLLPSARLAYTPNSATLLWAAVSRAIRSPTPFDHDVVEIAGPIKLVGNPNFLTERLVTYEGGWRASIGAATSVSVSAFYNDYDRLRNVEITPGTVFPIFWGNGLQANTYGVDLWGDVAVTAWWRLTGSFDWLETEGHFRPKATTLLGEAQLGDDPEFRASIGSDLTLGHRVAANATLRYVDKLPAPRVPPYVELDARLAWQVSARLEIAVVGRNLLHDRHLEYTVPSEPAQRAVLGQLRWRY